MTPIMSELGRYEAFQKEWWEFDPKFLAMSVIQPGESVLDVGCSYGEFGAKLAKRGCQVDGIDFYKPALAEAKQKLRNVYCLDLNTISTQVGQLPETYDVLTFMDVLEHCVDPDSVLGNLKAKLKPGGRVYVSLPNIVNIRNRMQILLGKFNYTEYGVLDRTHLRFFTLATACQLVLNHFKHVSVVGFTPSSVRLRHLVGICPGLLALQFVLKGQD